MSYMISILWILGEVLFYQQFWSLFFKQKLSGKKYWLTLLFSTEIIILCMFLNISQQIYTAISMVLLVTTCVLLFEGSFLLHLLVVFLGLCIVSALDTAAVYGTSLYLGISAAEFVEKRALYVIVCTAERLLLIFLGFLIGKIRCAGNMRVVKGKWVLLSAAFPCMSFLMLWVLFDMCRQNANLSVEAILASCVLAVVSVSTILLVNQLEKNESDSRTLSLYKQQRELQAEHILALKNSYQTQRKITHDFRSQLQTISDLLEMNHVEEARDYIRTLRGMQTIRQFLTDSGQPVVDAILNHKNRLAQERNMDFEIQINDLSGVRLSTDSLTVLLSNLLDNAIEACERLPDNRHILVEVLRKEEILWLSVKNTSQPVEIQGDTIPTSKTPKFEHGYGLLCIVYTLHELGAEYAFHYQDGWFTFVAEIPLPN